MTRRSSARFYWTWIVACGAAELVGIAMAAAWWAGMDHVDPDPASLAEKLSMLALKAASGVPEGLVLGTIQALVLRMRYPALPFGRWIAATTALAVFGWAAGSAFPIFASGDAAGEPSSEPPLLLVILLAGVFGGLVGALFGLVQAAVLRQAASGSRFWILANSAAWAAALPLIYAAAAVVPPGLSLISIVMVGVGAGLAAGMVLGAVTATAFRKMPPLSRL